MGDFNFYINRQGIRGLQGIKGDQGDSPVITVDTETVNEYILKITNPDGTELLSPNLRGNAININEGTYVRYNTETGELYTSYADNATGELAGVVRLATDEDMTDLDEKSVVSPSQVADALSQYLTSPDGSVKIVQNEDTSLTELTVSESSPAIEQLRTDVDTLQTQVSGNTTSIQTLFTTTSDINSKTIDNTADISQLKIRCNVLENDKSPRLIAGNNITLTPETQPNGSVYLKIDSTGGGSNIDTYVVSTTMDDDLSILTVSSIQGGVENELQYQLGNVYARKEDAIQYNVETDMGTDSVKEIKVTGSAANLKLSALGTGATSEKEASIELQSANTSATGVNGVFIKTTELASDKSAGVVGLYLGGETTPVCLAGEGGNFKILPNPRTSRTMGLEIGDDSLLFRKADDTTVDLLDTGITDIPVASATTLGGIIVGDNLTITEEGVLSANASRVTVDEIDGGNANSTITGLSISNGGTLTSYAVATTSLQEEIINAWTGDYISPNLTVVNKPVSQDGSVFNNFYTNNCRITGVYGSTETDCIYKAKFKLNNSAGSYSGAIYHVENVINIENSGGIFYAYSWKNSASVSWIISNRNDQDIWRYIAVKVTNDTTAGTCTKAYYYSEGDEGFMIDDDHLKVTITDTPATNDAQAAIGCSLRTSSGTNYFRGSVDLAETCVRNADDTEDIATYWIPKEEI